VINTIVVEDGAAEPIEELIYPRSGNTKINVVVNDVTYTQ
jgi:hypothetical protein